LEAERAGCLVPLLLGAVFSFLSLPIVVILLVLLYSVGLTSLELKIAAAVIIFGYITVVYRIGEALKAGGAAVVCFWHSAVAAVPASLDGWVVRYQRRGLNRRRHIDASGVCLDV
jgi:hypothetical protein